MGKVYINLHPDYDYSVAVIGGYIDLKTYIRNLDWASWLIGGRNQIQISSNKGNGAHLDRANVFAQRLLNAGHEVLIRNERKDDWSPFEDKGYTEEYMHSIEIEPYSDELPRTLTYIQEDIEHFNELIKAYTDDNKEIPEWMSGSLTHSTARYDKLVKDESERINTLKGISEKLNYNLEFNRKMAEFLEKEKERLAQENLERQGNY